MKRLVFILIFLSSVAFADTANIYTDSYDGEPFSGVMSSRYIYSSYQVGGPNTYGGTVYIGNRSGDDSVMDGDTSGEFSNQAVISFRITPTDVPVGKPITDIKLYFNIQDVSFPTGSKLYVYQMKRTRADGTLYTPSWAMLDGVSLFWTNFSAGLGGNWESAHTHPDDVFQNKVTVTSTVTSDNPEDYSYYSVDVDSAFLGNVPQVGVATPIDLSFLIMSADNDSLVTISNYSGDRNDPIKLAIVHEGNLVATPTVTDTPNGGLTPTYTATVPTPTVTSTPTNTPTPTNTGNTPTPTPTNTGNTPTLTRTFTKTWTLTPTVTATLSPTFSQTRTSTSGSTPTATPTRTITSTPTTIPTDTVTPSPTTGNTSTLTPTWTTTRTMTPTNTTVGVPTPTQTYGTVVVTGQTNLKRGSSGYIANLVVGDLKAENITSDKGKIGNDELFLEGGISVTSSGLTVGTNARWERDSNIKLDHDTYLTPDGLLYLEKPNNAEYSIGYSADYWDAVTGTIATTSTSGNGTLKLGYGNAGLQIIGTNELSGKLQMGATLFIELDVADSALEFDNQNTSLRDANAQIHFGAEQGGTGFGESYIKWNTTDNQFTIGGYTYPTPGAVDAVTIDTDDNSVLIAGDLTVMGDIFGVEPVSIVNASQVTAGTFGDGSYVFQDNLTFSGTDPVLNFPNSDFIKYTNSTAQFTFSDGTTNQITFDIDGGVHSIGAAPNAAYKLYVLNSGSSGPDYAGYFSNTSTEETTLVGLAGFATGAHGTSINVGILGSCSGSTVGNRGGTFSVSGSSGTTNYGATISNGSTGSGTDYGAYITSSGANGTNTAAYVKGSGGSTNWDLYTDGTQSRIAGMLQLTDTGQQITVNTTSNLIQFGNSSTADQFTIDTDNGDIVFAGKMNPGSEFTVTGQLGYYDGTTFKGIASVGNAGEVLSSQGAGQPPIFAAVAGAHDAVTLDDDPYNYLSIASQVITLGQIDLATDVTGLLPIAGLATLTASKAVVTDATGNLSASSVTATELGYMSGVTSSVQTQLNSKSSNNYGSANRVMQTDALGDMQASNNIDTTELGWLNGVTSGIQGQINAKQNTITGSATTVDIETLSTLMAMATDASGKISVSSVVSAAELDLLDGVTSAIQTQLNAKQATITGSATTVDTETLTASRAVQTDGTGKLAVSSTVDTTELGYLDGVNSAIQTQLGAKQATITGAATTIDTEDLTVSRALQSGTGGKVEVSSTVSTTELGFLDGVTSAIQTQLDGKLSALTGSASSIDTETLTANRAVQTDGTGLIAASSSVDTTELGFLDGVTSAIQTQLNAKQATITGSGTTIDTETLTASRAMATDVSGKVGIVSAVDSTELGYLDGVTSAIQTQIAAKQATITGSATTVDTETLTASMAMETDGTGKIAVSSTVSSTELGYLNGVSSAIQTQLNNKQATITGAATTIDTEDLAINRALQSNASGKLEVSSSVDTTELGFLDGVTSAIQTQLGTKQATITGSATTIDTETLTASMAMETDASGKVAASSTVSSTELGYLNGVTSAIQTQLGTKQATITGSATTVDTETLTASRAMATDVSGKVGIVSAVDTTELGYLDGVTSAIQTQIAGKQATITGSATTIDTETLATSMAMETDASGKVAASSTISSTELGYLNGVTSAIQTQLDGKVDESGTANQTLRFTGTNTAAASSVIQNNGTDVTITGNVTMADAKTLTAETVKAVDTDGVQVKDKDGNLIAIFANDNDVDFYGTLNLQDTNQVISSDTTNNYIQFGTAAVPGKLIVDTDNGNVTMVDASTLVAETVKAVDTTGLVVNDKDANLIATFGDDNKTNFAGNISIDSTEQTIGVNTTYDWVTFGDASTTKAYIDCDDGTIYSYSSGGFGIGVVNTRTVSSEDTRGIDVAISTTTSTSGDNYGADISVAGAPDENYGIFTVASGTTGQTIGGRFSGNGHADIGHFGVYAQSIGNNFVPTGTGYGIYASSSFHTTDWAGYFDAGDVSIQNTLNHGDGSALTIDGSDVITVSKSRHSVTCSGASDALLTINGGTNGDILYLCGTAGKTITVTDGTGNIECGSNRTLDGANDWITLVFDSTDWQMVSLSLDN